MVISDQKLPQGFNEIYIPSVTWAVFDCRGSVPKAIQKGLVYCDNTGKKGEKVLDKIIAGKKTMIIRGAAGRKIPHSRVYENEELYFMEKGSSKIIVRAKVKHVDNYVKLSDEEISQILDDNQAKLNLTDKQKTRWHKKCLCLVEFYDVEAITPLAFEHQGNMDDWLILDKIEDVIAGTSIPYSYEKSKF